MRFFRLLLALVTCAFLLGVLDIFLLRDSPQKADERLSTLGSSEADSSAEADVRTNGGRLADELLIQEKVREQVLWSVPLKETDFEKQTSSRASPTVDGSGLHNYFIGDTSLGGAERVETEEPTQDVAAGDAGSRSASNEEVASTSPSYGIADTIPWPGVGSTLGDWRGLRGAVYRDETAAGSNAVESPLDHADPRCQPLPPPHDDRCGPWFINIGVYKAATRQVLIDLDRCHPEVVRPVPPENARGWFWEPSMWGTQLKERDFQHYLPLIGEVHPGDFKVTGEKSPDYFFLQDRYIRRLKRLLPRTKVFVIIREPGERLFSHFLMNMDHQNRLQAANLTVFSPSGVPSSAAEAFDAFLATNYRSAPWAYSFRSILDSQRFLQAVSSAVESGELDIPEDAPRLRDGKLFFGWDYRYHLASWAREFSMNSQLLVVLFEHLTEPDDFAGGVDRLVEFLDLAPQPGVAECFKEQGDVKHHEKAVMSPISRRFLSAIFRPSVDQLNAYLHDETDVNVDFWYDKMYPFES